MTNLWFLYAFFVEDVSMVKFGITRDLSRREYQLRWGEVAAYVTWDCGRGKIVASHECLSEDDARSLERMCLDESHAFGVRNPARGGRSEWFNIPKHHALKVFDGAIQTRMVPLELTDNDLRKMRVAMKKAGGFPSVDAFIRSVVVRAAKEV